MLFQLSESIKLSSHVKIDLMLFQLLSEAAILNINDISVVD